MSAVRGDVQGLTTFASVLVTCEHAGNRVPPEWAARFSGHEALLASHRGWDPGALELARRIADGLGAPLVACLVTRLLADPNRSQSNPALHGAPLRSAGVAERERALEPGWRPHREEVAGAVGSSVPPLLHLSVHSFTPVLDGVKRPTGIGLLYDPASGSERELVHRWAASLRRQVQVPVHLNQPYRGTSDGLTTTLRRSHPTSHYAGIEIEVRSDLLLAEGPDAWAVRLLSALRDVGGAPGAA